VKGEGERYYVKVLVCGIRSLEQVTGLWHRCAIPTQSFLGSCGELVVEDSNDNACGKASVVTWNSLEGEAYFSFVFGYDGSAGLVPQSRSSSSVANQPERTNLNLR
jgi:hypothetical protein